MLFKFRLCIIITLTLKNENFLIFYDGQLRHFNGFLLAQ